MHQILKIYPIIGLILTFLFLSALKIEIPNALINHSADKDNLSVAQNSDKPQNSMPILSKTALDSLSDSTEIIYMDDTTASNETEAISKMEKARINANCKYKDYYGSCLYSMKPYKVNEFPKKKIVWVFKADNGFRVRRELMIKKIRHSGLSDVKPVRVPMRYWQNTDWNNPKKSNKKQYQPQDRGEFLYVKFLAGESDDKDIKTVITPGGATLTIRSSSVEIDEHTTESSHMVKRGWGIKADFSLGVPFTSIAFGAYGGVAGNIQGTLVKGKSYSQATTIGDTEYTNKCLTICCPVYAYLAMFQNIYRVKYALVGSLWVDYEDTLYPFSSPASNPNRNVPGLSRITTLRYQYGVANRQYTFTVNEPGRKYIALTTELVGPNNMGIGYCSDAEIKDMKGECKLASKRIRNSVACKFGGDKP